jgi:polygalacturonase
MNSNSIRSFIVSILLSFLAPLAARAADAAPAGVAGVWDVRDFGAKGDGTTLDSAAIDKGIDAVSAAGGGTLRFPAGNYLCVSIHLKSNITLYLDHGATLLAAAASEGVSFDPPEDNPASAYQDFGHSHWHNSLLVGENVENVSILGPGMIWGKGLTNKDKPKPGEGNKSIALKLCRNIVIRDISILHGGHFGILATGVDNFTVDNLKIDTNRDGIDIDCCRNVRVANCSVNSPADDGICLKACFGLGFVRDTENVTITNCQVSGYVEGTFLDGTYQRDEKSRARPTGRIKFGTESNGGFKNITVSNCVFDHCRGLALETVDGGMLEDVAISNITMRDIVNSPIFIRLGNRARGPEGTPVGQLRRVVISNVVVSNADPKYASIISGIPGHPIEDVRLDNIKVLYQGGGTREQAALDPPEKETAYPEPSMFGETPAWGFFIRHVKGIQFSNMEIGTMKDDQRPAFWMNDVTDAEFTHVRAEHAAEVPTFQLKDVEGLAFDHFRGLPDGVKEKVQEGKF